MEVKNYLNVEKCGKQIEDAVVKKEDLAPFGSIEHPDRIGLFYCGLLDSVDLPEDKRHCPFLGYLTVVDDGPRYICTAFESTQKAIELDKSGSE